MVKEVFQIYKDGQKSSERVFNIKNSWEDITVGQYLEYMSIVKNYEAFKLDIEPLRGTIDFDNQEMQGIVFLADMVACITGIDKEFIYQMPPDHVIGISQRHLEFIKSPPSSEPINKFVFRSEFKNKIEKQKAKIAKCKNVKEKLQLKATLLKMEETTFHLSEIQDMSLETYIAANNASKEIKKIYKEMKELDFSRYPEILGYVVRVKGRKYSVKTAKKYGKIFIDLPFTTAFQATNFFLKMQQIMYGSTMTFLGIKKMLQDTSRRPQRKKS